MLSQYVGSLTLREGWGEASQPEIRYKELFELALNNPEMKDSIFVPTELTKLKEIAELCPFVEGNAVYMARVILHAVDPNRDYINYCEFAKSPSRTSNERRANINDESIVDLDVNLKYLNYSILPNPSSGLFNLKCPSNIAIACELFTVTGQTIEKSVRMPEKNIVQFNFGNLSKDLMVSIMSSSLAVAV
jgi:hypothetical protein